MSEIVETGLAPASASEASPVEKHDLPAGKPEMDEATKDALVNINKSDATQDFKDLISKRIVEARTPPPPPPPPAKPTARQMTQTEREMKKGAERVKFFKDLEANRPKKVAEPTGTTPVFVPADHVPQFKEGKGVLPKG